MKVERNSLEVRAAKHAALADPARLRMLDLLSFGDLSPTELLHELPGMTSNLLAHHLKVLERVGIVSRTRSEGDGRRMYVALIPGALVELGSFATAGADRVVFVCSANSARSQLAQALWNDVSEIPAVSAGTHPAADVATGAVAAAARHGLDLAGAAPQQIEGLVKDTDFVITVCDRAHEEFPAGMVHWSVPDPVPVATDEAFEATFADLSARVTRLAPRILALT
ncbi:MULTISPECIES: arsenate reductase/protein-tyrosine-phosphatase family protein [Microbacterium]|uniref:arsenate reductase/protein-tyrosine-phosphatase family protein n=1 Tax=Microbacterium TaxID=33882 RepID=UPI00077C7415|nr:MULTISPECIES: helix-turn-helix domain-containing protein [Microbacterium]QOC24959.1 helix-turn-helix domain-containing protein [Microbacterium hominis]QOC29007.1 helix-turn-helix domain-containing protein [Microbacterium hominis]QYF98784.1 helix-turn-helix domain-containing protein [Microbacterium sp. PAMC21962]